GQPCVATPRNVRGLASRVSNCLRRIAAHDRYTDRRPTRGIKQMEYPRSRRGHHERCPDQTPVRPWCDLASPARATSTTQKTLICSGFVKPSDGLEPCDGAFFERLQASHAPKK